LITSNNARSLTTSKFLLFIKKTSEINFVKLAYLIKIRMIIPIIAINKKATITISKKLCFDFVFLGEMSMEQFLQFLNGRSYYPKKKKLFEI